MLAEFRFLAFLSSIFDDKKDVGCVGPGIYSIIEFWGVLVSLRSMAVDIPIDRGSSK